MVRRHRERGHYERELIEAILDEGLICHVGFVEDGHPFVIPTTHARSGDVLYFHGSPGSRMLRTLKDGADVCVTVTIVDGLVLARSAFHHSMNYRSAVILGKLSEVIEPGEKMRAAQAIADHVAPGRWPEIRWPNEDELRKTTMLALDLSEASAKVRTGPPVDDEEDYGLPVWAGVLPLSLTPGEPMADPRQAGSVPVPDHVSAWPLPGPQRDGEVNDA
jgi:nitroimidazol reductase NimA-like FMN-containing flavoprotein (pyridoxamine 5'-phosphate oxidase superfamily)